MFTKRAKGDNPFTWQHGLLPRRWEKDSARTRSEHDELRARVNTLQAGTSGGSSTVDTQLLPEPTEFQGKEEDWTRFSLKMKSDLGATDPR